MDLDVQRLDVTVDGHRLVRALDLHVPAGEVVGLVGPNGSGKSTTLRCLYRALAPSGGAVLVGGDDLARMRLRDSALRVSALTQDSGSDLDFTVAEVVALGRSPHRRGGGPLTADDERRCTDAMRRLDVLHLADRGVLTLSGGERQRVLVARAVVQEAPVLVLDEPTNHLDVRHQVELLALLRALDRTVVVVLHDLNLAAAGCDRVAVLNGGALVATGAPREVLTAALVADVFGVRGTVVDHPLTGDPQILFTPAPREDRP